MLSQSHHRVARDTAEFALSRMVGVLATVMPLAALIQALTSLREYRQPAAVIAVWLAMFPVALWLVPRIRTGVLSRRESVAAIAIALTAVVVVGWEHRVHYTAGRVDLAILGTVWLLALVALSSPAWLSIPGAVIVFSVHAMLLIRDEGANRLSLTQLEAAGYIVAAMLIAFAALRPTIALHTRLAARRAALASRSVAEQAAATAVQEDRRYRHALLELEVLPLLRAVADGALNPAAGPVRDQCGEHAAALRQSLTDRAPRADGLLAELGPVLKTASARGMLVDVRVVGDPGAPPPEVASATRTTVDAVLTGLPPQPVTLTVLASGDDVELYLAFAEAFTETLPEPVPELSTPPDVPDTARWQAIVTAEQGGAGLLEISWRKAVPVGRRH